MIGAREDDGLVLLRATEHIGAAAFGEAFDQHLHGLTDLALVGFKGQLGLQRNDLIESVVAGSNKPLASVNFVFS